jgi:hypothetical protein
MQCLVEVSRNYYDFIQNEIPEIFKIIKENVILLFLNVS